MKKGIIIFLLSLKLFAQETPASESTFFTYDKFNYGVTLNNVISNLFQLPNGELVVSEYSGYIYKISNTSVTKALTNSTGKDPLLAGYFKFKNGIEYYCGHHVIIVAKDGMVIQRIKINSQNDFSNSFYLFEGKIYFATNYKNGDFRIRSFNCKTTNTVIQLKKDLLRFGHSFYITDKLYFVEYKKSNFDIYSIENGKLFKEKSYTSKNPLIVVNQFVNPTNFSGSAAPKHLFVCTNGTLKFFETNLTIPFVASYDERLYKAKGINNQNVVKLSPNGLQNLFNTTFSTNYLNTVSNKATNSYYVGTNTNFIRFFPNIKKYPRLYNKSNSSSVFSLLQKDNGQIWAGSYSGFLTTINQNKINQSKVTDFMFLNGGLTYKDKLLLFAESQKGVLLFTDANNYRKIIDSTSFFYAFKSSDNKLYLGSSVKGLWYTQIENLNSKKTINWKIVNEKNGLKLYNILTICEDKYGNIWTGRTGQGIAVYNVKTNKAITWQLDKNEIDFGSMAILLDTKKTLWFGKGNGGLCYYDGKSEFDYSVKNFKSINHPLLNNNIGITFLKQWNDYLILGAKDKVLLFNLKEWYQNKKVLVRYLNSQETNFLTPTEQNTCLIDNRDESIWFSTSDMVYQWDIKKWLTLPTFKVVPNIIIKKDSIETEFSANRKVDFKPTENSFDVEITYQTKDNLPRFINGVLVKKGEEPIFESPNLQTKFQFKNLSAGEYVFYVRVCQQDGSFTVFEYPIYIDNFVWQKWWFVLSALLLGIGVVLSFYFNKIQIERQKKKLSQLNLSSLSNQFRPHFMLNALNSIGSQLRDKPHAEKVISRLGESINILYGFTQKNRFTLSFQNEMKLVENSIEIQKTLFIPELKIQIVNKELIPEDYLIPVGLLQIPVENALIHGLRHKTNNDSVLKIEFSSKKENYFITILDNGVGRARATKINNFKTNGNGLKTVLDMIEIINQHQKGAISFEIEDLLEPTGTIVKINMKKFINYDKIKL